MLRHTGCLGHVYIKYGARGITVCDEWKDFNSFQKWAVNSGYESTLTIDRIDNDKGYYPDNCRWVNRKIQGNNKSSNHIIEYGGVSHTISEWSEILGVCYNTLWGRIKRNDMRDFEAYFA